MKTHTTIRREGRSSFDLARKQRGVAAVELGLLIIPLVLLAFGITEFGRAIYQYNTLTKATRDATRYLSAQSAGDVAEISGAKCLVAYGNKTCTGRLLVPNLTASMIRICDSADATCIGSHKNQDSGSGVMNLVTVTITGYQFITLVPFVVGNITFGPISTTMRQVL
jgi:Flp pilus assembly protein TadG